MSKRLTQLHIETGPGGWLKAFWRREDGPENVIYVRLRPPRTKRHTWSIMGLEASKHSRPPRLSTDLLTDVPHLRIELAVAASDVFKSGLTKLIDQKVDARDLDAVFRAAYRDTPRTKLERPPRGQRDDDFLRKVALAYRQAVAAGLPPLKTMAEDSGIPQGTIARWTAEAREGKFLPPAESGKVSV
jgi:hypothetical protein